MPNEAGGADSGSVGSGSVGSGSGGDLSARLGQLFEDHAAAVEAFVRGLTRDGELAADVTQTVFTKAIETLPDDLRVRDADEFTTARERSWLLTVARNETMSRLRRLSLERRSVHRLPVPRAGESVVEHAQREDEAVRLRAAVETLNDKERSLIERHFGRGWTFARIAEADGEPLGTVLSRSHRAIAKLRKRLSEATP